MTQPVSQIEAVLLVAAAVEVDGGLFVDEEEPLVTSAVEVDVAVPVDEVEPLVASAVEVDVAAFVDEVDPLVVRFLQTNHFSELHLASSQVRSTLLSWRQFCAVPP